MANDTFKTLKEFTPSPGKTAKYHNLAVLEAAGLGKISRLPRSIRVVLEALVRHCDGKRVSEEHVKALAAWQAKGARTTEIPFVVVRIVLQDLIGFGALNDLSAMRAAAQRLGMAPGKVEPLVPVDVVVDHSVEIDVYNRPDAVQVNQEIEFKRNAERYRFVKWAQGAFKTVRVVPPGNGIIHQINMEHLSRGVWEKDGVWFPDTVFGTDSHTTMVNGIGILAWGVGGIEAEAGMLGQPYYFLTPDVVGVHMTGKLREGVTATDLVLTVTELLRKTKVVGKFVEYFGEGAASLSATDRATVANMSPDYGATCGFFAIDETALAYYRMTGREEHCDAIESYLKAQGMFGIPKKGEIDYSQVVELDLSSVRPSVSGPKQPEDRINLENIKSRFTELFSKPVAESGYNKPAADLSKRVPVANAAIGDVGHGDIGIAAITSCTNTSNPSVLIAAGLLAKNAVAKGLKVKPWVKTSLAPGSQVVTDYLLKAGLTKHLDALGFNLVGYGCTTCIGNSGPLAEPISKAINENGLVAAAVISGNRNFEGRVSPDVRANFLASPPLVVAYALKGTVIEDFVTTPIGQGSNGQDVFLKDIWPSNLEVAETMASCVTREMFQARYADVYKGDSHWQAINVTGSETYQWRAGSTYVANPPYFEGMSMTPAPVQDIVDAKPLLILGDSITTDHISPAGNIKADSPAGAWLMEHQVAKADFNSYGARRGHHEVMMRGTFANIRIKNEMVPGIEGGMSRYNGEVMPVYDAAMKHKADGTPMVVVAGKEYGTGSSRDWAAKGTNLLGVRAVIVESFERIHRSNLVGMGVLPLQFMGGDTRTTLGLDGDCTYTIHGVAELKPRQDVTVDVTRADGSTFSFTALCRIDTANEVEYFMNGGILQYVLRKLAA